MILIQTEVHSRPEFIGSSLTEPRRGTVQREKKKPPSATTSSIDQEPAPDGNLPIFVVDKKLGQGQNLSVCDRGGQNVGGKGGRNGQLR